MTSTPERAGPEPPPRRGALNRLAGLVAGWSLAVVFALFVAGIGSRYLLHRPIGWIDEAVTLLSVWSTFWTAAFVLTWQEHIAFDVLFGALPESLQRLSLLAGCLLFIGLIGWAMPGLVDYTLFLWRERTDTLQLRLDHVFAVFPAFLTVMAAKLAAAAARLAFGDWRAELARWSMAGEEAGP
jgi:TRAP-type C4-dicarboxylate transport system permease small subunit